MDVSLCTADKNEQTSGISACKSYKSKLKWLGITASGTIIHLLIFKSLKFYNRLKKRPLLAAFVFSVLLLVWPLHFKATSVTCPKSNHSSGQDLPLGSIRVSKRPQKTMEDKYGSNDAVEHSQTSVSHMRFAHVTKPMFPFNPKASDPLSDTWTKLSFTFSDVDTLQPTAHFQGVYTSFLPRPLWNDPPSTFMWMLQTECHITRLFRDFLRLFLNQRLIFEGFSIAKVRTEHLHVLRRNRTVDHTVCKSMDSFCRWTLLASRHSCLLMFDCFNPFKSVMLHLYVLLGS